MRKAAKGNKASRTNEKENTGCQKSSSMQSNNEVHETETDSDISISYPVSLEISACQLAKPVGHLEMCVVDVQQQLGGDDCGLYSIAFAASLALGLDPRECSFNQADMRASLVRSLEAKDIRKFVNDIVETNRKDFNHAHLFEWCCKVHCHCQMPDTGSLMVQCSSCRKWFHDKCESGRFEDPSWVCRICQSLEEGRKKRKARKEAERKEDQGLKEAEMRESKRNLQQLQKLCERHCESKAMSTLLDRMLKFLPGEELPEGSIQIGCMPLNDYRRFSARCCNDLCGVTLPYLNLDSAFIIIFKEIIDDHQKTLNTVVHEMAHAVHLLSDRGKGQDHGKEFRKYANSLLQHIKHQQKQLPPPYNKEALDKRFVTSARSSISRK